MPNNLPQFSCNSWLPRGFQRLDSNGSTALAFPLQSLLETGLTQSFGSRGRYGLAFPPIIKADPSTGVVSKLVRSYLRQQQAAALARELRAEAAKLEGKPREQGRCVRS